MEQELFGALEKLIAHKNNITDLDVMHDAEASEIREHLKQYDFEKPVPLREGVSDTAEMLEKWQIQVNHPRYFGLFNPAVTDAAVAGDALAAIYNPQLAVWIHSPAAVEIEQHTLNFLMRQFGLDPGTGAANFTSGGMEVNLSAVLAALTKHFPEYDNAGLRSIKQQPVFYVSEEAHHSFVKTAHITGLGRESLRTIPVKDDLKLDLEYLEEIIKKDIAAGNKPFFLNATAGTTGAGVIDPIQDCYELCKKYDMWLHVDGAWGGAAVLSDKMKPHLKGTEKADSITCDAHKWLSVSVGAGMFFCRHRDVIGRTFRIDTTYMPGKTFDTVDYYTTTIQWSRRFIGLKLFLSLLNLGRDGYAKIVNQETAVGNYMKERIARAGWRIINDTPLPVVCFDNEFIKTIEDANNFVNEVYKRKRVWISAVTLKGSIPALRACINNYKTLNSDVDILIDELTKAKKHSGQ